MRRKFGEKLGKIKVKKKWKDNIVFAVERRENGKKKNDRPINLG